MNKKTIIVEYSELNKDFDDKTKEFSNEIVNTFKEQKESWKAILNKSIKTNNKACLIYLSNLVLELSTKYLLIKKSGIMNIKDKIQLYEDYSKSVFDISHDYHKIIKNVLEKESKDIKEYFNNYQLKYLRNIYNKYTQVLKYCEIKDENMNYANYRYNYDNQRRLFCNNSKCSNELINVMKGIVNDESI